MGREPGVIEDLKADQNMDQAAAAEVASAAALGPRNGKLVVVWNGGANVRATPSLKSLIIGTVTHGEVLEYQDVGVSKGNGTSTCDVRRFRIKPILPHLPSGGWVSETTNKLGLDRPVCQPIGDLVEPDTFADVAAFLEGAGDGEGGGDPSIAEWGGWGGGFLDRQWGKGKMGAGAAAQEGDGKGEGEAPPTPQEAEMLAMGIERGVAMVALAKYDNKVEPAVNYVFDQMADAATEDALRYELRC